LLENIRAGRLLVPGTGRVLTSMTSVDNLAQACLLAAESTVGAGVFNIADSDVMTVDRALRGLLASAGAPARPAYLPTGVTSPLAAAAEFLQRHTGHPTKVRLNRYVISQTAMERTLDITAARRHLAYAPSPTTFPSAREARSGT
jgi:2-alkyl-3-oxoalkanoate reductase